MPNPNVDIFGDSKIARQREGARPLKGVSPVKSPKKLTEVIVVSSDEEDIPVSPRKAVRLTPIPPKQTKALSELKSTSKGPFGPFRPAQAPSAGRLADRMPIFSSQSTGASASSSDTSSGIRGGEESPVPTSPVKTGRHCDDDVIDLTLDSSDSDDDESEKDRREVISLIDDSPQPPRRLLKGSRLPDLEKLSLEDKPTPKKPEGQPVLNLDDGSDSEPVPKPAAKASRRRWIQSSSESDSEADVPEDTTALRRAHTLPGITTTRQPTSDRATSPELSPPPSPTKKGKAPRVTKKALREAEQARREAYAEQLFKELNASVFKGGLPETTALKWSVRLLTTAGRAKWRKSRDGTQTTEIELATKILDSDDRIRNTLSHEMCHLACWIINGDPKEGHGRAFKAWAAKVSRKRPDITVSTRHNYEIKYPYEWECDYCAKIYGRHSKSIKPEECRCGACKTGKLVPLFKTQTRAPRKAKDISELPEEPIDEQLESLAHNLGLLGWSPAV